MPAEQISQTGRGEKSAPGRGDTAKLGCRKAWRGRVFQHPAAYSKYGDNRVTLEQVTGEECSMNRCVCSGGNGGQKGQGGTMELPSKSQRKSVIWTRMKMRKEQGCGMGWDSEQSQL